MKVYIATDGDYSDYHIEAVFTDKKQAEFFCSTHGYRIEEYESDLVKLETRNKPKRIWCFEIRGALIKIWTNNIMTFSDIENFSKYIKEISLDASIEEEIAKKIICDKYYEWKAKTEI